jgi:hypothetical protein
MASAPMRSGFHRSELVKVGGFIAGGPFRIGFFIGAEGTRPDCCNTLLSLSVEGDNRHE